MKEIDDASIRLMVDQFYGKVRADPMLGPVFEARIGDAWGPHLDKMVSFWSTVLLARQSYRGNPGMTHASIGEIRPEHFERWLGLFEETLGEIFQPHLAELVMSYARRMSLGLQTHIARARA